MSHEADRRARGRRQPLDPPQRHHGLDFQGARQLHQRVDARQAAPLLDQADGSSVQAAERRQLFLGATGTTASRAQVLTEAPGGLLIDGATVHQPSTSIRW
jgi:hypothetical protein